MSRCALMLVGSLLACEVCLMDGCVAPATELDLGWRNPSHDHRKVAHYYRQEAAMMWKKSEDMTVRAGQYERLFGPSSDWVQGTRLLADSYRAAAMEQERLASEHQRLTDGRAPDHPSEQGDQGRRRP